MPAQITIDQATLPPGVAGKARSDGVITQLVTCSNSTAEGAYLWTLVDVPIRSALVRGTTGTAATFTFTPDVKGTYLVSLRVNASVADVDNDTNFIAVLSSAMGWRYLAAGEKQEDNETYAGLNFPSNINPRGWATNQDLIQEDVESVVDEVVNALTAFAGLVERLVKTDSATGQIDASLLPGIPPAGAASGDLTGTYPGPTVAKIRGRNIDPSLTPSNKDTLQWNNGASRYESVPLSLQTAYNTSNAVVVASSNPVRVTGDGTTNAVEVINTSGAPGILTRVSSTSADAISIQVSSGVATLLRRSLIRFSSDGDAVLSVTGGTTSRSLSITGANNTGSAAGGDINIKGGSGGGVERGGDLLLDGGVGTAHSTVKIASTHTTQDITSGISYSQRVPWTHFGTFTGLVPVTNETTTARTLTDSDNGSIIYCTNVAGCTITVSHTLTTGVSVLLVAADVGTVELDDDGAQTIFFVPATASSPPQTAEQYASIGITVLAAGVALVFGNLG